MLNIKVNKNILSQIFIWMTFILTTFPIMTFGLRSVAIIVWTLLGVLCSLQNKKLFKEKSKQKKILLLISISPFVYLTLSLLYTQNLDLGIKRLVQMLPLFAFPVIFYLNREKFDWTKLKKILWIFSISVLALVLFEIIYSIFKLDYLLADLTEKELISNNLSNYKMLDEDVVNKIKTRRFRNFILELTSSHFTYQGLWIVFSIFFIGQQAFRFIKTKKVLSFVLLFSALIMVIWMFLISARMPILTMLLSSFAVILALKKIKTKTVMIIVTSSIISLMSAYFIFTPLQVRVNEIFQAKFELPTSGDDIENYSSINVRNGIYFCAYNVIRDNIWFGTGVGDSQQELNTCYQDKIGAKIYTWTDYNTHNQFLFFLLSSGIPGVLLFMLLIYTHFKKALQSKNQIYLYFVLIFCLISLTENLLSRSDGVMFFAFFSGLFLFNLKQSE